jgi:hypothetical protein
MNCISREKVNVPEILNIIIGVVLGRYIVSSENNRARNLKLMYILQ